MIKVTAKCFIQKDSIEEFKRYSSRLIDETRKEEGCLAYELYQDVNEEIVFSFIEEWKNDESLGNHIASKHFQEIFPEIEKLCFKKMGVFFMNCVNYQIDNVESRNILE